uniref:Putative 5.3 kDa protein n=1 Tax=Ixodes ricinus TaxID=34613 RepID=A0A6B0TSD7_IXORI
MRATTLYLLAISLLVTANLVGTCIRGNDAYYRESEKYCDKPCPQNPCGWPCSSCKRDAYWKKYICK